MVFAKDRQHRLRDMALIFVILLHFDVNNVSACVKTKQGLFVVKFWAEWS